MTTESQTQAAILKYLGNRKDCKIWRQNSGSVAGIVARICAGLRKVGMDAAAVAVERISRDLGLHMKFGVDGCGDVSGIVIGGLRLEIEVKSDTGRQSEAQKNFQSMVEAFGGLYILARDVSDLYPWFPKES